MINWKQFWKEPEELVVGAAFGSAFCLFTMWWTALTAVACAMLWKLGGFQGGDKMFRRIGIPVVIGTSLTLLGHLPFYVAIVCGVASHIVLRCGYGSPDPSTGDAGSTLGRWWLSVLKVPSMADAATRATVGSLFVLCWFPLALLHPGWYLFSFIFLTIMYPVIEETVE